MNNRGMGTLSRIIWVGPMESGESLGEGGRSLREAGVIGGRAMKQGTQEVSESSGGNPAVPTP